MFGQIWLLMNQVQSCETTRLSTKFNISYCETIGFCISYLAAAEPTLRYGQ